MKQIVQDLKTGKTLLEEVPTPKVKKGHILIRTTKSLVSLGTERMLVEFGKAGYISKARQQPDKVKMVLDKIKSDGLLPTVEAVFRKLEEPLPLGYCNVGQVVKVGKGVSKFKVGDRVASNGHHAEYVLIPENLAALIPENVSDEEAVFTVIGAISLQGIRLLKPTLGETFVVYGLGLIGLLTAQLLKANGCRVIGIELDDNKIDLARSMGIEAINPSRGTDPVKYIVSQTDDVGADGVIITASSQSNEIISNSAKMSRKRGRIILIGVIGLQLSRADFYEKELSFQVSCSYGPGRYDDNYELKGIDYPLPYVRWTEQRNFEAILNTISSGGLKVKPLITRDIPFENYIEVYGNLNSTAIASLFTYSQKPDVTEANIVKTNDFKNTGKQIGIIGAGNFTKMNMMPELKKHNAPIKYIASSSGLSSTILAKKYGIAFSTSDYRSILNDQEVGLVIITTRHDSHADLVVESLKSEKDVFVEKPLALNQNELDIIIDEYQKHSCSLTVGFNRRFSPFALKAAELLGDSNEPINVVATMNAGFLPADLWVQDMKIGGGRIIGEACHYMDLISFFTKSKISSVNMSALGISPQSSTDNAIITLKYENGSQGVINYFSNGHKSYAKERIEIYSQGRTLIIDNFRTLTGFGFKGFRRLKTKQDKGHSRQFELLIKNLKNKGISLISFDSIINTTKASFAAIESLTKDTWIKIK